MAKRFSRKRILLDAIKSGKMKLASRGIQYDTPQRFQGTTHGGGKPYVATAGYHLSTLYARHTDTDPTTGKRKKGGGMVYLGAVRPQHLAKDRTLRERAKGKGKNSLHTVEKKGAFKPLVKIPYQPAWKHIHSENDRQAKHAKAGFYRRVGRELSGRADAIRKAWATRRQRYGASGSKKR